MKKTNEITTVTVSHSRASLPLSCILAYFPLLFWVPLAVNSYNPKYRHCANQGLWSTISCIVCAAVLAVTPAVLLGEAGLIHRLLNEWDLLHWSKRLACGILALIALGMVLYGPIVCIKGIYSGVTSDVPYRLPFVGRIKLIKNHN